MSRINTEEGKSLLDLNREMMKELIPDYRLEFIEQILDGYCRHCGVDVSERVARVCTCMRDE